MSFVYDVSSIFMAPFDAVFETQTAGGATIEWSALIAIAVYALLGWGAVNLIRAISPRRGSQTVERVEETDDGITRP